MNYLGILKQSGLRFLMIPLIMLALLCAGLKTARATVLMIDPAYYDPTSDPTDWARLITMSPTGSMAIMDPNNGPYIGSSTSPINQTTDPTALTYQKEYKAEVAALHTSGLLAIGYVSTQAGCRPYVPYTNSSGFYDQGINADIDEWKNLYGVDGIFLDEGPGGGTYSFFLPSFKDFSTGKMLVPYPQTGTSGQTFYNPVKSYINAAFPGGPIILNCGIPTDEGYMNVCSILCDAEEPYNTYTTNTWLAGQFAAGSWFHNYPANRFFHLVYASPSSVSSVTTVMNLAQSWNAGYVYCTDLASWNGLATATVWNNEVTYGGVSSGPVPTTPTGLVATAGTAYVSMTWNPVSRAASYNVYKSTTPGGEGTTTYRTGLVSPAFFDTVVNNGTTYYYKVAAVNTAGTSAQTAEVNGLPHLTAPNAPTGPVAFGGNGQNMLAWTGAPGIATWNLYRSTTAGGEGTTPFKTGITTTTYTDPTLTNGTTYYYKIAQVNGGGTSSMTSEVSATPAAIVPTAPYGLAAVDTSTQAVVTWYTSALATSYNIYRGTTSGSETLLASGLTGATYTNTGLTNGTTYYYKVAAVNAAGTSPLSAEMSTTPQAAAPSAPTGLVAVGASGQVTITWNAVAGATSYSIANSLTSNTETVFQTGVTTLSYVSTGLTNGTVYYFKVSAVNSVGTSALSTEASATPNGPPGAPGGLAAAAGNAQVSLTWTGNGASSYNIYRATTSGGEGTTPFATGVTTASYVNTGLTNGTAYYYKVAAVNGAGTSALSTEVSGTPNPPPSTPTGLTATAANSQVGLSWSASSGATSYSVYRGTTSGSETLLASGVTTTSYTNTGLSNGTTYFYKVAAVNSIGTSALSAEVSGTPNGPPSTPTGLAATPGNAQVALAWTAAGGATSYNIYRATTSGGEGTTAIATGVTTASYVNTGLTNGTTYFYKVAAVNSVGTSAQSTEVSGTPNNFPAVPTGLAATAGNAQVSLTWTAASGATSYNVYRGTTAGGESATPIVTGLTSPSYVNTGLTNTTTYYYKVAAVNSVGTSGQSTEVSGTPNAVPSTPSGLTATAGTGQVALTWTATANTTSYNLYRGTTAGGEGTTAYKTGLTSASYTDTAVTGGTTYYYKVAAVNVVGTSAQSTEASATPTNPTIYNEQGTVSGANLVLSFNYTGAFTYFHAFIDSDQNTATGYTIGGVGADYLAENATFWHSTANGATWAWSEVAADGGETFSNVGNLATFNIPLAAIGSPAHVNVAFQVEDSTGTPIFTTGSFTYAGGTGSAPAAPTGVSATPGNTLVALNWTASSGATSYNVYRGTTAGGESATPIATGITGTTYSNTGLTNGTTYYFKVAAVNSAGTSAMSSEVSATPANVAPPVPTGVTATAGAGQVAMTWSASSGATSYNVYRGTTAGGEGTTPYRTGLSSVTYTDVGVVAGTAYFYKVAAVGTGGTSAQSSEVSAAPTTATATIFDEVESISGSNLVVSFHYTGTFTYFHAFVDTDVNAATGYSISGIGADYLAENATFWHSTANGTAWSWAEVTGDGGIAFSNTAGVASWTIPLSSIGSPAHVNVVYGVEDSTGTPVYTTGAVYF